MPRKTIGSGTALWIINGFNEAAARCHGKPGCRRGSSRRAHLSSFNEAAARCHGKRVRDDLPALPRHASMRPRPDATENFRFRFPIVPLPVASMRPRPDATENCVYSGRLGRQLGLLQ